MSTLSPFLLIVLVGYGLGIIADCTTTYIGIKHYGAKESDWLFKHIAHLPLKVWLSILVVAKLATIPAVIWISMNSPLWMSYLLAACCLSYLRTPINNLLVLQRLKGTS